MENGWWRISSWCGLFCCVVWLWNIAFALWSDVVNWCNIVAHFIFLFRISQRKTEWYTLLCKVKGERGKLKSENWKVKGERGKVKGGNWKVKTERWKVKGGNWKVKTEKWKGKGERGKSWELNIFERID